MNVTSTLYIGIDVSLDTNQVCAMNFDQFVFFNQSFRNSLEDSNTLIRRITDLLHSIFFMLRIGFQWMKN